MDEKLIFKPLSLRDKNLVDYYITKTKANSYEYTFTSLYFWKELSNVQYALLDDVLILLKYEENKGYFFMMPYGYSKNNLNKIVTKLIEVKKSNNRITYLFGDVEEYFLDDLKNYTDYNYIITQDVNDYEYIYKTQELIDLKGKRFHCKKNHCNIFKSSYDYTIKTIDCEKTIEDCLILLENWHKNNFTDNEELLIEIPCIKDLLYNLYELNLSSIALYVDKTLAGFSVGEEIFNTAIIHIDRCNLDYKGVYSFLNNAFLIKDFSDTLYVNRQEDCGVCGLRKAKQSYHPISLLHKYLINSC